MAKRESTVAGIDINLARRTLGGPGAVLRFVGNVGRLFLACVRDPRVRTADKVLLAAVAVYLVSPVDLVPDIVPVLGQADDLALALWALRRLLQTAGPTLVTELWRGDDDGLALVLGAAGTQP